MSNTYNGCNKDLTQFPDQKQIPTVTRLLLYSNKIKTIPIITLKLTSLWLCNNEISEIPELPITLQTINLSSNKIKIFPAHLCKLKNLKCLMLSKNKIETLPTEISTLQNLTEFRIDDNMISVLPPMPQLECLFMGYNKIPVIDQLLPNLSILFAHNNPNLVIPYLNTYTKLKLLGLNNTNLTNIPNLTNCKDLTHLDLGHNQIGIIPEYIFEYNKLKTLRLNNNHINWLPNYINNNIIEDFNISNNNIRDFKPIIGLTNLKHLETFCNKVELDKKSCQILFEQGCNIIYPYKNYKKYESIKIEQIHIIKPYSKPNHYTLVSGLRSRKGYVLL